MNDAWTSHADNSRTQCCPDGMPCRFHRTFPGAVRSPHIAQDLEKIECVDCGTPPASGLETATS